MEERSKVVELKEASACEAPQCQRMWTALGCRNQIERIREIIWTASSVTALLATHDPDSLEFEEFTFKGLAHILDRCGGDLEDIENEIEAVGKHLDGLALGPIPLPED